MSRIEERCRFSAVDRYQRQAKRKAKRQKNEQDRNYVLFGALLILLLLRTSEEGIRLRSLAPRPKHGGLYAGLATRHDGVGIRDGVRGYVACNSADDQPEWTLRP